MRAREVDRAGSFEAVLHAGSSKTVMNLLPSAGTGAVPHAPSAHDVDGLYSPIQRLVDENGWDQYIPAGGLLKSSSCPPGTTLKTLGSYFLMYTDSSQGTPLLPRLDTPSEGPSPHLEPDRYQDTPDTDAERIGESAGAAGDEYRFRYDQVSPEEGYSPIAGVRPCSRSTELEERHVWTTHIDDDGAVCSRAIHGPLTLTVRIPDGSDVLVQVVDGMTVQNLREKLWNTTGIRPKSQRLVLPNGGELTNTCTFVGCGLQPGDRLVLRAR